MWRPRPSHDFTTNSSRPLTAGPAAAPWLRVDDAEFADAFASRTLSLRHEAQTYPPLERSAVEQLAAGVPRAWISAYQGEAWDPSSLKPMPASWGAADLALDAPGSRLRMTIYFLERLARYRSLLDGSLDQIPPSTGTREGGVRRRAANVFLAAPGAVVPPHIDRHHNVLLQISGTKEISIGFFPDRSVERAEIEREFDQGHHGCDARPELLRSYHLGPGDGLYIPPYTFHWVAGGSDVSIAFSCGFSTVQTERTELVEVFNARMRRLHLSPRPPGSGEGRDRIKAASVKAWRRRRRTVIGRMATRAHGATGARRR